MRLRIVAVCSFASCLLALAASVAAQESVEIYRCTDASGALTVQNDVPCPAGSQQQKTVMPIVVPPQPAAVAPANHAVPTELVPLVAATPEPPASPIPPDAAAATAAPTTAAASASSEPQPPPALYQCRTPDKQHYLSETATPPERCVRVRTTGLGGNPAMGVGAACRVVSDQCQAVADDQLCQQWQQHLRDARNAVVFGPASQKDAAQAEVERIGRVVRASTCGD